MSIHHGPQVWPPLHTVDIFDAFLSMEKERKNDTCRGIVLPADGPKERNGCNNRDIDDILKLAEFLFGRALDGALAILETNPRRDVVRLTSLQSNRTMYIVKGRSYRCAGLSCCDSSYMCILNEKFSQGTACTRFGERLDTGDVLLERTDICTSTGTYCSCRSFSERCQKRSKGNTLCKHLLAIKLMPFLRIDCSVIEVASDDEYCKIALQRIPLD
jgi:hypothetical protein